MPALRLSLCLIARDEALLLPGCLRSAGPEVDELIVLDTGSVDPTPALAAAAGAAVHHFRWVDDFSAARNAALAHATGDWVVVLDADERLLPGAGDRLRAAIEARGPDAVLLPWLNANSVDAPLDAVVDGRCRLGEVAYVPRLFRREPALRWEGVVHELPASWLAAPGRRVISVDEPIIHLGNAPDWRAARQKDARNRRLLELQAASSPLNPSAWASLATERLKAGDAAGGRQAAARAFVILRQRMQGPAPRPAPVPVVTVAAFCAVSGGHPAEARAILAESAPWCGPHPNLALLEAVALDAILDAGGTIEPRAVDAALHGLEAARAAAGRPFVEELLPGATSTQAWRFEGELRLARGEHEAALAAFQRAGPGPEAALGTARALLGAGLLARAASQLEALVRAGSGDARVVLAALLAQLGDRDAAARLLRAPGPPPTRVALRRQAEALRGPYG